MDSPRARTLLAALATLCAALVLSPVAEAKIPSPKLAFPAAGATVEQLPTFGWNPVAGAATYNVQLSADGGFNSVQASVSGTQNTRAAFPKQVPNATYYWRVQAVTPTGAVSPWSAARTLTKTWVGATSLLSPDDGAQVLFPTVPLKLAWAPVPGAVKYLVSIATDPQLGSLVQQDQGHAVETEGTVYNPGFALPPGKYYWGVTPEDAEGNRGAPSAVHSFQWVWNSTTTTSVVDLNPAVAVYDPQISWAPVAGAAQYQVEINSDSSWAAGSRVDLGGTSGFGFTTGLSITPPKLLPNNQYYWRVRAVDASGDAGDWNTNPGFPGIGFNKSFDTVGMSQPGSASLSNAVGNLRMRDNLTDPGTDLYGGLPDTYGLPYWTNDPIAVWDPVPGASYYEVHVVHYVGVYPGGSCDFTDSSQWNDRTATNAWTPLANGAPFTNPFPAAPNGITADNTGLVDGDTYCLTVRAHSEDATGANVVGDVQYLNGFDTFGNPLPAFTYKAPSVGATGCGVNIPCPLVQGDYNAPHGAIQTAPGRMPLFTWNPIAGAGSYYVLVAKDQSFTTIVDEALTNRPEYAPRFSNNVMAYPDETTTYYWVVVPAFSAGGTGGNLVIPANPALRQPFQKTSAPPAMLSPVGAQVVSSQPTFRWASIEGVKYYQLQVATDPNFSSPIDNVTTPATAYTSNQTYPADTTLYWRVRGVVHNDAGTGDFGLSWPAAPASFLRVLTVPTPDASNVPGGDGIPMWTWSPTQGATSYDLHVEYPDGSTKDLTVQSAGFTPTVFQGTGAWRWQVRANYPSGGSNVPSAWSPKVLYTRTLGEVTGPRVTDRFTHRLAFAWDSKLEAKSYHLEVSRNQAFTSTIEAVDTDNLTYAPNLTQGDYNDGGTFYWRVSAKDGNGTQGDFTPVQRFTLPIRMQLAVGGKPLNDKTSWVVLTVSDYKGKLLRKVKVDVSGLGLKHRKLKTDRKGTIKLRFKKGLAGKLVVKATKPGYQPLPTVVAVSVV